MDYIEIKRALLDLREEARKSWDYVISNKVVSIEQMVDGNGNVVSLPLSAEQYTRSETWTECLILGRNDELYCAIIEVPSLETGGYRHSKGAMYSPNRNSSVLVDIPQMVEPPQRVVTKIIPVVVRLQRLDYIPLQSRYSYLSSARAAKDLSKSAALALER